MASSLAFMVSKEITKVSTLACGSRRERFDQFRCIDDGPHSPALPGWWNADKHGRLEDHNARRCPHTARHAPWQLHVVIEFADEERALRFERYLKSGSGREFAKRHFGG